MELKDFCCPKCGGKLQAKGGLYECACGAQFADNTLQKVYEKMQRNLQETMGAVLSGRDMEKYRSWLSQLWEATQAKYADSENIVGICQQIKSLYPDNFVANFYEVANKGNADSVKKFLGKIDVGDAEQSIFIEDILTFMIKSLKKGYIRDVRYLIERAYAECDIQKFEKYCTLLETEANKLDAGVYEVNIPRHVFLAYSGKDMETVLELADYLENEGVTCFTALNNLQHGRKAVDNYEKLIEKAIDNCQIVVFVSSKNSRNMSCEALSKELPYIRKKDLEKSPYGNGTAYAKLSLKCKKPRIEYRIDNEKTQAFADIFLKSIS